MSGPIEVCASAPGKLILAGEHAAVYGYPALVAAVELRVRVVAEAVPAAASDPLIRADLLDLGETHELRWSEIAEITHRSRADWQRQMSHPGEFRPLSREAIGLVQVALGEARQRRPHAALPELAVRVESELPLGAGFGSSAAVASAIAATTLAVLDHGRSSTDHQEVETIVTEVERRQHGRPSGVDAAAVLRGGILWTTRGDDGLDLLPLSALRESASLRLFHLIHTGPPGESTGEVVAAVRSRYDRFPEATHSTLDRIGAATVDLRQALERDDHDLALSAIRTCHRGLEEIGVVPEPIRGLVRRVEQLGGAAKISGAGALSGPGAGIVLVYHPTALDHHSVQLPPGGRWIDASLGSSGLRIETP